MTQPSTPIATYAQRQALRKLSGQFHAGYPINPRTLAILEREGWVEGRTVTAAGLAQIGVVA